MWSHILVETFCIVEHVANKIKHQKKVAYSQLFSSNTFENITDFIGLVYSPKPNKIHSNENV